MNPMQILQMLQSNPSMMMNNPLFQRAMQMGQGKSEAELKNIVINLATQRGVPIEQLNNFIAPFGLKL